MSFYEKLLKFGTVLINYFRSGPLSPLCAEHGQPKDIMRSILPAWNTLAWFEVTEASHHQVGY